MLHRLGDNAVFEEIRNVWLDLIFSNFENVNVSASDFSVVSKIDNLHPPLEVNIWVKSSLVPLENNILFKYNRKRYIFKKAPYNLINYFCPVLIRTKNDYF